MKIPRLHNAGASRVSRGNSFRGPSGNRGSGCRRESQEQGRTWSQLRYGAVTRRVGNHPRLSGLADVRLHSVGREHAVQVCCLVPSSVVPFVAMMSTSGGGCAAAEEALQNGQEISDV